MVASQKKTSDGVEIIFVGIKYVEHHTWKQAEIKGAFLCILLWRRKKW